MSKRLSEATIDMLAAAVKRPGHKRPADVSAIVHFGIGGFHRSHQAYALQRLIQQAPELYSAWTICGVCILPQDKAFVDNMKQQDLLYSLRVSASGMKEEVTVMNVITNLLFGPEDHEEIIESIARPATQIISFTITEGGYNIDGATGAFLIGHPDIQHDLNPANRPKTVFGYLARGLKMRREAEAGVLTLMSCDNIQENGEVLQQALYSFLDRFDVSLIAYANANILFPNSMVDRITPVTQEEDRQKLEDIYGYRDECLVVCEPFFQWVIEKDKLGRFPPLEKAGVSLVADVRPYEKMKLGVLNGGHSLAGLIGKAMGYTYIYEAMNDERISALYDLYNRYEVIPSLAPLEDVSYEAYATKVKERFSNALIKDTTDRIISGSTAKIPKFILPVIHQQLSRRENATIGALVLASWWDYLDRQIEAGTQENIDDPAREEWRQLFQENPEDTLPAFINKADVFGDLGKQELFCKTLKHYAALIRDKGILSACEEAIKKFK